jgi:putative oxidoreductase
VFVGVAFVGPRDAEALRLVRRYGPQGTGGFFSSLGYQSGVQMAVLAGLAEAVAELCSRSGC